MQVLRNFLCISFGRQTIEVKKIIRAASKVVIIFPRDRETCQFMDVAGKTRGMWRDSYLCAIVGENISYEAFDSIIPVYGRVVTFSRKFFRLKRLLRNQKFDLSIDLNEKVDIFTYLIGAKIRVSMINSPFVNLCIRVKAYQSLAEKSLSMLRVLKEIR